jgi:N-acetylmuramoyl-L-alanine amidase
MHRALFWFNLIFIVLIPLQSTAFDETNTISINQIAKIHSARIQQLNPGKAGILKNNNLSFSFETHKDQVTFNGTKLFLSKPVDYKKNQFFINKKDYLFTLCPLLNTKPHAGVKHSVQRIVIDPGHGGRDKGTQNTKLGIDEKSLTLDVAIRLKRHLEASGFAVQLTRARDEYVELKERCRLSNNYKADLFISIHFNATASNTATVRGIESYILPLANQPATGKQMNQPSKEYFSCEGNRNDAQNIRLAYYIQTALHKNLQTTDRGIKRARFAVLKDLKCPGILIECGFLTHPAESNLIHTAAYRNKLAEAIASGILEYHNFNLK